MLAGIQNTPLASRAWRLQHLYAIRNADGVLEKFQPNEAQRQFYNRMWYCNHVLKARKLGFSTFIEVIFLDDLLFSGSGLSVGIVDYTLDDAEAKLGMMRTAYEHLDNGDLHPDTWKLGRLLKKAVPLAATATKKLTWANGSTAKCSTSLRGSTPQRLHVSELGKTAIWAPIKAREIINGAFNAMTPGNVRNIESTHEGGKAGEHYRLINQAMRNDDSNLTVLQSRFHFFPWWQDARYRLDARGHQLRADMREYFTRLERDHGITCDAGQMLWYDHKQREQGHGMKKEFPSTPGEAFEAISEGAIYGTQMADLRAKGRVSDFGLEANLPVFSFWDIGLSDCTSVWLIQPVGRWFLVLDWFEAEGRPGSSMPDQMLRWERKWNKPIAAHFLPHDAETRDRGSGKSYVSELLAGGLANVRVVPRTPDVWLGIGYVRDVLPHCWFHKTHCDQPRAADGTPHDPLSNAEDYPSGVACLEGYSKKVRTSAEELREMPKHDLFSHSCFPAGTMIATLGGEMPIEEVREGMMVMTPAGPAKVANAGVVRTTDTLRKIVVANKSVLCTGEHPFFTDRGLIQAANLQPDDHLWTRDTNLKKWNSMGPFTNYRDDITSLLQAAARKPATCTGPSGCTRMAVFLKGMKSIIRIMTVSTTGLKIWNAFRGKFIARIMPALANGFMVAEPSNACWKKQCQRQPNGIDPKQAVHGTESTGKRLGRSGNHMRWFANIADHISPLLRGMGTPVFAVGSVSGVLQAAMSAHRKKPVDFAVRLLSVDFMRNTAPIIANGVQCACSNESVILPAPVWVYDLTVERHHCYYANGFLVSNCDAFRTFAEAHARGMIAMHTDERPRKPAVKGGIEKPRTRR